MLVVIMLWFSGSSIMLVDIKPWQERSTQHSFTEDCSVLSICRLDGPRLLSLDERGLALVHPVVGVGGASAPWEEEKSVVGEGFG